jgi:hypothetical protein
VLIRTFEVSEERVSAIGYGEDTPLFDNDTAEHRKANRRVVAIISSKKKRPQTLLKTHNARWKHRAFFYKIATL